MQAKSEGKPISKKGKKYSKLDPKPSDLFMDRVKWERFFHGGSDSLL
jgi:hypothetical protein